MDTKHKLESLLVDDNHTDVAVLDFADRTFILLTQFEKMGSMISATPNANNVHAGTLSTFNTKVLLGKDEVELHALAHYLAEKLQAKKPLLFGMAFKKWPSSVGHKLLLKKISDVLEEINPS